MMTLRKEEKIIKQMQDLNCCVIIPTYNNANTLQDIIERTLKVANYLIVINDGATDTTKDILAQFSSQIEIIHLYENNGKGYALKRGFERAIDSGFDYAITLDSDGQHNPEEIPNFLEKIKDNPKALIIGSRNLNQDNVPQKNSFANRFSNFWYKFFTGVKLKDTQSGFRLYPLKFINHTRFFTNKYDFEFEALVKASWKGYKIIPVIINVYYPPIEKRVSHFRPFRDFARISLLNTYFFFVAVFVIKPFKFARQLTKENIKKFLNDNIFKSKDSNSKIVFSVILGVFMGIIPIWGYQLIAAIALAHFLRLNKLIVGVAANISITPLIPIWLYLSYLTGGIVLQNNKHTIQSVQDVFLKENLFQYVIGSFIFGIFLALLLGTIVLILLKIFRKAHK